MCGLKKGRPLKFDRESKHYYMIDKTPAGQRKCPFCAEMILAEAIKCRFCQSMLVDDQGQAINDPKALKKAEVGPPGVLGLLIWNLMVPGLGSWKLGYRLRGGIILGVVSVAMVIWGMEAMEIFNKILSQAIHSGNAHVSPELMEKMQSGFWYEVTFWVYLYSFIDMLWLYPWKGKPTQPHA